MPFPRVNLHLSPTHRPPACQIAFMFQHVQLPCRRPVVTCSPHCPLALSCLDLWLSLFPLPSLFPLFLSRIPLLSPQPLPLARVRTHFTHSDVLFLHPFHSNSSGRFLMFLSLAQIIAITFISIQVMRF